MPCGAPLPTTSAGGGNGGAGGQPPRPPNTDCGQNGGTDVGCVRTCTIFSSCARREWSGETARRMAQVGRPGRVPLRAPAAADAVAAGSVALQRAGVWCSSSARAMWHHVDHVGLQAPKPAHCTTLVAALTLPLSGGPGKTGGAGGNGGEVQAEAMLHTHNMGHSCSRALVHRLPASAGGVLDHVPCCSIMLYWQAPARIPHWPWTSLLAAGRLRSRGRAMQRC